MTRQIDWIPVNKKMPKNDEWHLVTEKGEHDSERFVVFARYIEGLGWVDDYGIVSEHQEGYDGRIVLAWSEEPLPEPYRGR